jgi:hypothetical protein
MVYRRYLERITPYKATALILLAFMVLAVVMTWPLASQLDSHFPGDLDREDHWVHQWTFWWVKQAIVTGQNPLFTRLMFFPDGVSLSSHNIPWLNIAAWLPLQTIFGQTAAYNLVFLATFVFNAFAGYLLALDVTKSRWAAFVGGIVFGFWPYTISHFDHPNLIVIGWIPLSLLYLRRTLRTNRSTDMLLTVLFVVLAGITRWQHLILSAFVLGFYSLWVLVADKSNRSFQTIKRLMQIAVLSGIALLVLSTPLILDRLSQGDTSSLLHFETDGQVDILAYFTPSRYHPLWGDSILNTSLFNSFRYNTLYIPFLGFLTLILAVIGLIGERRKSLVWGGMALFLAVMAMGSILRVGGELYPQIPLPYRLIEEFDPVRLIRRTDRFNIILSIPISILVSLAIFVMRSRINSRFVANGITLLLASIILFEALPLPLPTISIGETPAWYDTLASEQGEFAIVDLPLKRIPFKKYMFYQISHGKPTVQGRLSRVPTSAYEYIETVPFLAYLRSPNSVGPPTGNISEQLQMLSDVNVRYIVAHKSLFPAGLLDEFMDWLPLDPVYEDEVLSVYRTSPQYGRDYTFQYELSPSIGIIDWQLSTAEMQSNEDLQARITWGTSHLTPANYDICFEIRPINHEIIDTTPICQSLFPEHPTAYWQQDELYNGNYELSMDRMPAGQYDILVFLKQETSDQLVGPEVSLGTVLLRDLN